MKHLRSLVRFSFWTFVWLTAHVGFFALLAVYGTPSEIWDLRAPSHAEAVALLNLGTVTGLVTGIFYLGLVGLPRLARYVWTTGKQYMPW